MLSAKFLFHHSIHRHTQTAQTVTSVSDKALRLGAGHNFPAAGRASSEVKMSTALSDFNLPLCCWSTRSLASAQSNLQCNPQPDCFPSSTICTRRLSRLAAEKKHRSGQRGYILSLSAQWSNAFKFRLSKRLMDLSHLIHFTGEEGHTQVG